MTILDEIIAHKKQEIVERRKNKLIAKLEKSNRFNEPRASFVEQLKNPQKIGIIAEFKRSSPSKGTINETASIREVAEGYTKAGVSGISVLTDEKFFGGSYHDLEIAFDHTNCPILRKDFIIDEYQIVEAKSIGASAILLIAACLSPKQIKTLSGFAASLGLEVLFEVHSVDEIPDDLSNIGMIGVNNRNLRDFSVDIKRSLDVAQHLPDEIIKVSESGLNKAETIYELKQAGFDGFLIGENFMRTKDPGSACSVFIEQVKTFAEQNQ